MTDSLDGTWIVTAYLSGDEFTTPEENGRGATLTIGGDSVFGTMGVNRFTGRVESGRVVGPLATTRMAGPPGLMEQEELLLNHLTEADVVEVDGDGMLASRAGLILIELRRSGTIEDDASSQHCGKRGVHNPRPLRIVERSGCFPPTHQACWRTRNTDGRY